MSDIAIGTDVNQIEITSLPHITGQPQVINLLRMSINSFFQSRSKSSENTTFGPCLLTGPSGTGKTLVAKAIHAELGNLSLIETNGEMLSTVNELTSVLLTADDNTTIFIDEAMALNTRIQHLILTAISERHLYTSRGSSSKIKCKIPLANFVLILACTHEYQLQDAMRNRMRLYCRFDYYSIDDLTEIVKQRADALGWEYESVEVLRECAIRAKQTPRLALNRNLQMAYNVAISNNREVIKLTDIKQAFDLLYVDSLGLDALDQAYLRELSKCESMKLNVIASKVGLPRQTIVSVIEPFLLRSELIEKQGSDRVITDQGKNHIENSE